MGTSCSNPNFKDTVYEVFISKSHRAYALHRFNVYFAPGAPGFVTALFAFMAADGLCKERDFWLLA